MRSFFTDSSFLRRRRGNRPFSWLLTMFLCMLPKTAIGAEYSPERPDTVSSVFFAAVNPPTNVQVTLLACGLGSPNVHLVKVTWNHPASGDVPVEYEIVYGDGVNQSGQLSTSPETYPATTTTGEFPADNNHPANVKIAVRAKTASDEALSVWVDIPTAPDAPTGVSASVADGNDVTITWATGSSPLIQWSRDNSGTWENLSDGATGMEFEHFDVPEGTHGYRVGAKGSCYPKNYTIPTDISWTQTTTTVAVQLERPQNVRAVLDLHETKIDLTWELAAGTVVQYVPQVKEGSNAWTSKTPILAADSYLYEHSSLTLSTDYLLRVIAEKTELRKDTSSVVRVTTRAAPKVGKPQNVRAVLDPLETMIDLTWDEALADNRDPIDYYVVQVKIGTGNFTNTPDTVDVNDPLEYRYSPLLPSTEYRFKVKVVTDDEKSATSSKTDAITTSGPGSLSPPRNLMAVLDGNTAINLTWEAAYENPTNAVTHYVVEVMIGSSGTWIAETTTVDDDAMPLGYSYSPLEALTQYSFRVIAITDDEDSPPSNVVEVIIAEQTEPSKVKDLTAAPLPSNKTGTIRVTWTVPDTLGAGASHIELYEVVRVPVDTPRVVVTVTVTTTSHDDSGLEPATGYTYQVRAKNNQNVWGGNETVTAYTEPLQPPGMVTGLNAVPVSTSSIEVSWDAPDDGGSPITQYHAEKSSDGSQWSTMVRTSPSVRTSTETGLSPNETRYYRVRAKNVQGLGDWSDTESATSLYESGTLSPPQNLDAVLNGDTAIDLTWLEAAEDSTDAVSHYVVEVMIGAGGNWEAETTTVDDDAIPLGYRYSPVIALTTYKFRVIAITDADIPSEPSNVREVTTSTGPVLGPPRNLMVELNGDTAIDLTWTAAYEDPTDSVASYLVRIKEGSASYVDGPEVLRDEALEYRHSDLETATRYEFTVIAITNEGERDSATINITTSAGGNGVPGAPPKPTGSPSSDESEIEVNWSEPDDTGDTDLTVYKLQVQVSGETSWETLVDDHDAESTRSHIFDDVSDATSYRFRVRAKNDAGWGPYSPASDWVDIGGGGIVYPPTDLAAEVLDGNEIHLTWNKPSDGPRPDIYIVHGKKEGTSSWTFKDSTTNEFKYHENLAAGETWVYRVRSKAGTLQSDWTDEVSATTDPIAPGKPRDLKATPATTTSIKLTWTAPASNGGAAISGYRIQASEVGSPWEDLVEDTESADRVYTHSGIEPNSKWRYQLKAINVAGEGPWSNEATAETEANKPSVPRLVSAEENGPDKIIVGWFKPDDDGGAPITGYRIQTQPPGKNTWEALDSTDASATFYRHTGLNPGSEWTYRVAATNKAGRGAWSFAVIATTETTVPSVPRNLSATTESSTEVRLTWTKPVTDGGLTLEGYRIEYLADNGSWRALVANSNSMNTGYLHRGLDPGSEWTYRVRAINSKGIGPASSPVSATTDAIPPGLPENVTAEADGAHALIVAWDPPANDGGSAITKYQVEIFILDEWRLLASPSGTRYRHTGLDPESAYSFRVSAVNTAGRGEWSEPVIGTSAKATPSEPLNLKAERDGANVIILTWDEPVSDDGYEIEEYEIRVQRPETTVWEILASTGTDATSYRHTDLPAGSLWIYQVRGINSFGAGEWSSQASARTEITVPSVPRDLSATTESTEIQLTWKKPVSDGGLTLEGYRIEYLTDDGSWSALVVNSNSTDTGYLHRGLDPGSEWTFRVSAINSLGVGPATNAFTVVADAIPPDQPENVIAGPNGAHAILVSWDPPLYDGGSSIINYQIEIQDHGQWFLRGSSNSTQFHHTNLDPESTFTYRVGAMNSAGTGAWSEPVTGTSAKATPSEPLDLMAEADGAHVIILTWDEPVSDGGYEIEEYEIRVQQPDTTIWEILASTETDARSYRHTGLLAGSLWAYQVRAINSFGSGDWSDMTTARTDLTPPTEPRNLVATNVGSDRIDLVWDTPEHDGGSRIWHYIIEYLNADNGWQMLVNQASSQTSFTHGGLAAGANWTYRVRASNNIGLSEPSQEASARTDPIPPDPPENVTAEAEGPYMINLRWSEPSNIGGAEIMEYVIESNSGDGLWEVLREVDGTTTEWQHRNLEPASTWNYRVKAVNEAGPGLASASTSATTNAIRPDPPTYVRATADGTSDILVTWRAPEYEGGATILHYKVEMSTDGLSWHENSVEVESEAYRHTGLDPASTWYYRVSAVNAVGSSGPSEIAFATTDATVPGAPEEFGALALDHETVRIAWNAPAYNGGAEILGYALEYSLNGEVWEYLDDHMTETEYMHEDLMPATDYHYRVAALNVMGAGAIAGPVSVETPARVPDAPEDLIAAATAPTVIELSWTPPAYDGGAQVIGYKVETLSDQDEWRQIEKMIEGPRYEDTSVSPGETRHYRVYAVNIAGLSEASNTASATTDDPVARANRVTQAILPVFMATATEGVVKAISDRIETSSRDDHNLRGPRLRAADRLTDLADGMSGETSSGMVGFWFRSEVTSASDRGSLEWEGRMLSAHTGMDVEIIDGLRGGLALSQSNGSFDFTDAVDARSVEGDLDAWVVSATPYVSWRVDDNFSIWGAAGMSMGATTVTDAIAGAREADSRSSLLAVGMSGWLMSGGTTELSIRAEGWQSGVTSKASDGISEYMFTLRRVRAMLDWTHVNRFSGGHELHVKANGGMRSDLNEDAENRSGVELGGGMRFQSPENRLKIEGMGRYLFSADSDYSEWGFGGLIELDPAGERGLALEVEPSYGSYESQTTRLYNRGSRLTGQRERDLLLAAKVQYRRPGAAAPYGRLLLGSERPTLVLGSMFPRLKGLSLEGTADRRGLGIGLTGGFRLR